MNIFKTPEGYLYSNKALLYLFIPLLVEYALEFFVGLADSIMVASLGEAAISGVSLVDFLMQFLIFSFSALADGSFGTGFEDFISDQFIGRNHFVGAKLKAETIIGKKENHGILIGKDGYLIENSADLTRKNLKSNLKVLPSTKLPA